MVSLILYLQGNSRDYTCVFISSYCHNFSPKNCCIIELYLIWRTIKTHKLKVVIIFSFTNKVPISETAIKILLGDFSLIIPRRSPFQRSKKKNVFMGATWRWRKTIFRVWMSRVSFSSPVYTSSFKKRMTPLNLKDYKNDFKCSSKRYDLELKVFWSLTCIVSFSFQIKRCRPSDLKKLREWNTLMNCKYKYFNHSEKYSRIFKSMRLQTRSNHSY